MQIKITKLSAVEGGCPAASKDEYIPGTGGVEGKSIPVDYWLTGKLLFPIKVGEPVIVARDSRNGVKCDGMFQSTPVVELILNDDLGWFFRTANSVYEYSYLTPEDNSVSLTA